MKERGRCGERKKTIQRRKERKAKETKRSKGDFEHTVNYGFLVMKGKLDRVDMIRVRR